MPSNGSSQVTASQYRLSEIHSRFPGHTTWHDPEGNTSTFFTPEINKRTKGRLDLENGIRVALEQRDFVLYYQPKVAIETGRIVGVEALVRWQHPIRGLVPPDEFVPVAEECGLIVALGNWVLRTACETVRRVKNNGWGYPPPGVMHPHRRTDDRSHLSPVGA